MQADGDVIGRLTATRIPKGPILVYHGMGARLLSRNRLRHTLAVHDNPRVLQNLRQGEALLRFVLE